MKKILLAPYFQLNKNNEQFYTFSSNWAEYLNYLQFETYFYSESILNLNSFDALVLPGSGDLYQTNKLMTEKKREKVEKKLIKFFINKKKPILTVCRGSLFISSINQSKITKIKNHVNRNHNISYLGGIINSNSFHNYQIKSKPKGFTIIGKTKDNCIEMLYNNSKNILSLMFHPERKNNSQKLINKLIKNFFNGTINFSSR
tara:strand:+ start:2690 stop:3295 length:606 start_codon:yes stop_codon:yes gene_type:complete